MSLSVISTNRRSSQLSVSLWMLVALSISSVAHAENLFSWDGESTDILIEGEQNRCLSLRGATIIDSSEKHQGNASIRHTLSGSQRDEGCDPSGAARGGDIFDGKDGFMRFWMKIDSDLNWGPYFKQAKIARMTRTNEKIPGYTTIHLGHSYILWGGAFNPEGSDKYFHLNVDFDPKGGGCRTSQLISNLGAECTDWREYVLHYKRNSCVSCEDGFVRLYVNGQLADQHENISFANYIPEDGVTTFKYAWGGIGGKIFPQICPNDNPNCGAGGIIWIDDISIDTTWNSLVSNAPLEARRPAPPAPLKQ